jgi:hypothetical protein
MERAARLFSKDKRTRNILDEEGVAHSIWPAAVGKAISAHTSPAKLVRDKLIVNVADAIWQRQLNSLSRQIIDRMHKLTGSTAIQELEFRVAIPRRSVQRAEHRELTPPTHISAPDEADQISDPVLKKVYRLSRKKATA